VRLLDQLRTSRPSESRSGLIDVLQQQLMFFQGNAYPLSTTMPNTAGEKVDASLVSYTGQVYRQSGPVFACILARMSVFSEARFAFRRYEQGRPQEPFTTADLEPLERPWMGGTTGDLLSKMLQHADLTGNAYVVRSAGGGLRLLRPDWVTIVIDSPSGDPNGPDARVLGYRYQPAGDIARPAQLFPPNEVAHFAPIPDPLAAYRGMSWLTPVVREIQGDQAMTVHKNRFFEHAATPNLVVKVDPSVALEAFREFKDEFLAQQQGVQNAYKTLFLGGGADATVVGRDFQQMDFKAVQGASETRIAAAAGVPPIIAGFSEGLSSATYSNYAQARRRFADGTLRPLWRNAAASLETVVNVPAGAHLWYSDRDIAFLREDANDQAVIQGRHVTQVVALVRDGFTPESSIAAVKSGDLTLLEHTGNLSVQLQPSNPDDQDPTEGVDDE
jgi:HK97 family phage portal protein